MPNNTPAWRLILLPFVLGIMLAPAILTALMWTTVNLVVTTVLILVAIVSYFFSRSRLWYFAVLAALAIAIPPYPYLIDFSATGSIVIRTSDIYFPGVVYSLVAFALALILFRCVFWIFDELHRTTQSEVAGGIGALPLRSGTE